MTKLYLDETNIENFVLPNLKSAIRSLNNSIYAIGTLKVPDDFEYSQYLKQICNKNYDSSKRIEDKIQILEKSIQNYKKIEKENLYNFSDITILNIPKRVGFKK